jgi:hypothetical protein
VRVDCVSLFLRSRPLGPLPLLFPKWVLGAARASARRPLAHAALRCDVPCSALFCLCRAVLCVLRQVATAAGRPCGGSAGWRCLSARRMADGGWLEAGRGRESGACAPHVCRQQLSSRARGIGGGCVAEVVRLVGASASPQPPSNVGTTTGSRNVPKCDGAVAGGGQFGGGGGGGPDAYRCCLPTAAACVRASRQTTRRQFGLERKGSMGAEEGTWRIWPGYVVFSVGPLGALWYSGCAGGLGGRMSGGRSGG